MTRLARSESGHDMLMPADGNAVLDDIQITRWNLERNSITAKHITSSAITTDKIAADAITADHISADSVGTRALTADSVTARELAAESVSADDIVAGSITTEKLDAGAVTTDKLDAGAVTADKIDVAELSAISADIGTIELGTILVDTGGVLITSDPAGGTPTTGIVVTDSAIKLINSSAEVMVLDGAAGEFTIRTASSGARVQMDADGLEIYDASDEIGTELTASGLALYNQSEDAANPTERIDFYDGTKATGIYVGSLHGYIQTATGRYMLRWTQDLNIVGNVYANNLDNTWQNFNSTVTGLGNMVLSNVTRVWARYCDIGPTRHFEVAYSYTVDPGTLSYHISFTVPDTSISQGAGCHGYMNIDGVGARQAYGYFDTDHFDMRRYDNATFTAGTGRTLRAYGWYTIA